MDLFAASLELLFYSSGDIPSSLWYNEQPWPCPTWCRRLKWKSPGFDQKTSFMPLKREVRTWTTTVTAEMKRHCQQPASIKRDCSAEGAESDRFANALQFIMQSYWCTILPSSQKLECKDWFCNSFESAEIFFLGYKHLEYVHSDF